MYQCARLTWLRYLALAYPVGTLLVIVGTANHFIIDAVGGAVVLGFGFLVQWALAGHGAFRPPVDATDYGLPNPPLPALPR
jgi:hypothetical protein